MRVMVLDRDKRRAHGARMPRRDVIRMQVAGMTAGFKSYMPRRARRTLSNRPQATAAAVQEFEAQTLLLQSQLDYTQAQDELNQAIGLTAQ